ncbi:NnrU family protein [Parasalinivibrio latis]|uniref:NnrU family protein n=1 Tax=Parasalinivibrio latis TaxID=2952610 RepID=UPI0030DFE639
MSYLVLGLVIWSLVHFIPSAAPGVKQGMVGRFGENGYKGIFSLLIVLSLVFIVLGWRSSVPEYLYTTSPGMRLVTLVLMIVAFLLFGAAKTTSRIKQYVRHPQLTSVIVWSVAHLISNGDSRSLVLFGGLGLWAIVEIILINRREGEWKKPSVPTWMQEARFTAVSLVIMVVVVFLHPYIAGVPLR